MNRDLVASGPDADRGVPPGPVDVPFLATRAALTTLSHLPEPVVRALLDRLVTALARRHPAAFERFAELAPAEILVAPDDMPCRFTLLIGPQVRLRLVRGDHPEITWAASVRGRFADLAALFEGRVDADALFFSRDLAIDGDTGLLVAVRNAIDNEVIDLGDEIAALIGPPATLARALRGWLLRPVLDRLDRLARQQARANAPGRR
ncbi:MAG: SCP2 sterol-binding domain-containing protein [Azospirillaceae bacterium]|nr:SCP2 sterol-binding domain-containing protein [Azospirillaceae bacterium]